MLISVMTIVVACGFVIASIAFLYSAFRQFGSEQSRFTRRMQPEMEGADSILKEDVLVPENGVLGSFERYLKPSEEERTSRIQKKLIEAGYRSPSAMRTFLIWKWTIAFAGLFISSAVMATMLTRVNPLLPILNISIITFISYFAADMWLARTAAYRKMAIEKSFPDALDLLLVCIEAGNGLDQAIHRVAREMKTSAPELSTELQLVVDELRAGKVRNKVLSDFAAHTGVEDIAAFVTVIKQADKFGVSIADTLRVYSKEMRNKRYMKAEEIANMMPVKMALGAIAFTVPPVILILIGPSIILILREMAKATSGGIL